MGNYMFDTVIFNRILDRRILIPIKENAYYFVTHIQIDEINATKDVSRRQGLLKVFNQTCCKKVPTESAVWNVSKWDEAKYSDEIIRPTESFVLGHSRLGVAKLGN